MDRSWQKNGDQAHLLNHHEYSFTAALHVHIQILEQKGLSPTEGWADVSL